MPVDAFSRHYPAPLSRVDQEAAHDRTKAYLYGRLKQARTLVSLELLPVPRLVKVA